MVIGARDVVQCLRHLLLFPKTRVPSISFRWLIIVPPVPGDLTLWPRRLPTAVCNTHMQANAHM